MRSTLLLSIRPRFVDGILAGTKKVELRRRLPRLVQVDRVLIYSTAPVMAVVGFFAVERVERQPLPQLWHRVRDIAGITKVEFDDYFSGLCDGVGIYISKVEPFVEPVNLACLRQLWTDFTPPQGFRYILGSELQSLLPLAEGRSSKLHSRRSAA